MVLYGTRQRRFAGHLVSKTAEGDIDALNGPVCPLGTVTIEPLDVGDRSKLTLAFELKGQGRWTREGSRRSFAVGV